MKPKTSNHGPGLNGQGVRDLSAITTPAKVTSNPLPMAVDPLVETIDRLRKDIVNGDPMLRHFRYGHLPPHLRVISRKWAELAVATVQDVPRNAERTVALRKLLEGKDCAVRAILPED